MFSKDLEEKQVTAPSPQNKKDVRFVPHQATITVTAAKACLAFALYQAFCHLLVFSCVNDLILTPGEMRTAHFRGEETAQEYLHLRFFREDAMINKPMRSKRIKSQGWSSKLLAKGQS